MSAGKITLQANDGKTLSLVAPEGMVANTTEVVTTPVVINNATSKTTPTDNDEFAILDSATTFSLKKLTFANLKARLLSYFDTFYSRKSEIFGVGQTWQDVTASRSSGVTYTNTTTRPIYVKVQLTAGYSVTVDVGGVRIDNRSINSSTNNYETSFVVSINTTYKVTSNTTIPLWAELR